MKIITRSTLFILFLIITGCASIAGENTRSVYVNSEPAGAKIFIDNQQYGITPATVSLPSYIYGGKTVTLKKTGFEDQTIMVNSKFQPIALLDIIFWPALFIDAATGDLVKIDPANLNLNLKLQKTHN
jgi:hypothetical protein